MKTFCEFRKFEQEHVVVITRPMVPGDAVAFYNEALPWIDENCFGTYHFALTSNKKYMYHRFSFSELADAALFRLRF